MYYLQGRSKILGDRVRIGLISERARDDGRATIHERESYTVAIHTT
jgi:hypothetical protein